MSSGDTRLVIGEWNAICDVCGFEFKSSQLIPTWDKRMVCKKDWEPRHPSDFERSTREDTSVPWTRPESADSGGSDISGNTFPATENTTQTDLGTQVDTNDDNVPDGTFGSNNGTL